MKSLSLILDDAVFDEAEVIMSKLSMTRNDYINKAVKFFNSKNKRRLLKEQLIKESKLTKEDSLKILHEFEQLM